MMKKALSRLLLAALILSIVYGTAACSTKNPPSPTPPASSAGPTGTTATYIYAQS